MGLARVFILFLIFSFNFNFSQEINWISLDKAQKLQKTNPKNIILDAYTNWCGPCKLMDRNTFQNKYIIQHINEHYKDTTIIAGGGITDIEDIIMYKNLGADHFAFSTVLFHPLQFLKLYYQIYKCDI